MAGFGNALINYGAAIGDRKNDRLNRAIALETIDARRAETKASTAKTNVELKRVELAQQTIQEQQAQNLSRRQQTQLYQAGNLAYIKNGGVIDAAVGSIRATQAIEQMTSDPVRHLEILKFGNKEATQGIYDQKKVYHNTPSKFYRDNEGNYTLNNGKESVDSTQTYSRVTVGEMLAAVTGDQALAERYIKTLPEGAQSIVAEHAGYRLVSWDEGDQRKFKLLNKSQQALYFTSQKEGGASSNPKVYEDLTALGELISGSTVIAATVKANAQQRSFAVYLDTFDKTKDHYLASSRAMASVASEQEEAALLVEQERRVEDLIETKEAEANVTSLDPNISDSDKALLVRASAEYLAKTEIDDKRYRLATQRSSYNMNVKSVTEIDKKLNAISSQIEQAEIENPEDYLVYGNSVVNKKDLFSQRWWDSAPMLPNRIEGNVEDMIHQSRTWISNRLASGSVSGSEKDALVKAQKRIKHFNRLKDMTYIPIDKIIQHAVMAVDVADPLEREKIRDLVRDYRLLKNRDLGRVSAEKANFLGKKMMSLYEGVFGTKVHLGMQTMQLKADRDTTARRILEQERFQSTLNSPFGSVLTDPIVNTLSQQGQGPQGGVPQWFVDQAKAQDQSSTGIRYREIKQ